jgi:prepilin-type N-terminal cleavage/methylation domain-containing protein
MDRRLKIAGWGTAAFGCGSLHKFYRRIIAEGGCATNIRIHGRRGFTLVEIMVSSAISLAVAIGLTTLAITAGRLGRAVFYQQISLKNAQGAIEGINREIRLATTPLRVVDNAGAAAAQGNRVLLSRLGEPPGHRAIELVSADGDLKTPWDNTLVYDPNTDVGGDELVIAHWVTPIEEAGGFRYGGATTPLTVWMRAGDPVGEGAPVADTRSGPGMQGAEINITVAPRN